MVVGSGCEKAPIALGLSNAKRTLRASSDTATAGDGGRADGRAASIFSRILPTGIQSRQWRDGGAVSQY